MSEPEEVAPPSVPPVFHAAMVHLYRGEMHRMTVWRTRLDTTSHWAILLTTGMTTFALGSPSVPHFIMLLALALNTMCMLLEARRFQHLHHCQARLRMLEEGYFAALLNGRDESGPWRQELARDLERPCATMGLLSAARQRLRRNYLMLFLFATAVWATKLVIHPASPRSFGELYGRLAIGALVPPWFVAASACAFVIVSTGLAVMRAKDPLEKCPESERSSPQT